MEKCDYCGYYSTCIKYTDEKRDECRKNDYKEFKSRQELEIETIKERDIKLKLSDADVDRLFELTGAHDMTPAQLLESFIGDLVGGTYTNGSDERDFAERYFERCWFGMFPEYTFLRHLVEFGEINSYLEDLDDLETAREELEYLQGEEYKKEEPDDDARAEEIEQAKGDVEDFEARVLEYYNYYKQEAEKPEECEKAMQSVKEWNKKRLEMQGKTK